EVNRGAMLFPRLGEEQRPAREIKGGEADATRRLGPGRLPVQPARHHEMDHDVALTFELEDEPFAEAPQLAHGAPDQLRDRRIDAPEHERADDSHPPQRLTDNP